MIFPSNDVGYAMVQIIDHRRQQIEERAIFANDNRVADIDRVVGGLATHQIVPGDVGLVQLEPPVGFAPFGFQLCNVFGREGQGGPIINRRFMLGTQAFAFKFQLVCIFIARIQTANFFQGLRCGFIPVDADRLTFFAIPGQTQPCQICADALDIFFLAARCVRIVKTENKFAAG